MHRVMLIHAFLCALLAIQQPSVVVRSAAWQQSRAVTSAQNTGLGSMVEEEKLPGMRESCRPRMHGVRAGDGGLGVSPVTPRREARVQSPDLPGQDFARSHWRAAQLPRTPMDDDPPQSV